MNSFMSSIKSAAAGAIGDGDEKKTNPEQPSSSDLLSSAKQVAEAAQFAASNQSDKIDKPKVAGAAADILEAAQQYGKFDETQGVGQYLKKADDYLHQYEKSSGTPPPPTKETEPEAPPPTKEAEPEAPPPTKDTESEAPPPPAEEKPGKEESGSGFGAGDALKAAGSFFK